VGVEATGQDGLPVASEGITGPVGPVPPHEVFLASYFPATQKHALREII
jgi:hypothetical protein